MVRYAWEISSNEDGVERKTCMRREHCEELEARRGGTSELRDEVWSRVLQVSRLCWLEQVKQMLWRSQDVWVGNTYQEPSEGSFTMEARFVCKTKGLSKWACPKTVRWTM